MRFSEFVNESRLSDVNVDSIINDKFINLLLGDTYNDESLKYQYMGEEGVDDEDDIDENDFSEWIKYELETLAENFIGMIRRELLNDGKMKIWRAMTVSSDWESKLPNQVKHLGVYWSWDKSAAEPHWGYSNDKPLNVIMEAEVDEIAVDWEPTIRLNIEPVSYEEKEVRLVKGSKINITSITIDGTEIDISDLSGERFVA
jgi:hypothetical protein